MFLHNCIGLANFRYFIQLLVIAIIGSFQTLFLAYLTKDSEVWYHIQVMHPVTAIMVHVGWSCIYTFYLSFFWWMFKRDFTTIDFMMPENKFHYQRIFKLSLPAKTYLYFGTPSLWRALLMPLPADLPINGLEFENECKERR
jgi:hypothetical protein